MLDRHGKAVFGVSVDPTSRAANRWHILGRGGSMQTAGIGGPIVGKGADLMIIDDPIRNSEEAMSATIMDKHWQWFLSTAEGRMEPKSSIVIIMHRWHTEDLVGRAQRAFREVGRKVVDFRLPAIAEADDLIGREEGQPLWPERYPVEKLREKERLGPFWFSALYQGRPVPLGGALFRSDWFRRFTWVTQPGPGSEGVVVGETGRQYLHGSVRRIMVVDPSLGGKGSDRCAIGIFGLPDDAQRLFVLHMVSERIPLEGIVPRLSRLAGEWKVDACHMESNGFQVQLAKSARLALRCPVREVDPEGKSKLVRATGAIELCCAGDLLVPESAPWLVAYQEELCQWTGNDGDRDDQCLIGGTLIETSRGAMPIESIVVGDKVLTRCGYRKVLASGMTSQSAKVFRLTTRNGLALIGTAKHPVFSGDRGFVAIDELTYADSLVVCKKKPLFSWAKSTAAIQKQSKERTGFTSRLIFLARGLRSCIGRFGSQFMAQSKLAATFIMQTAIRSTMQSTILSARVSGSIGQSISVAATTQRQRSGEILSELGRWQANGTNRKPDGLGIASTAKRYGPVEKSMLKGRANDAESNIWSSSTRRIYVFVRMLAVRLCGGPLAWITRIASANSAAMSLQSTDTRRSRLAADHVESVSLVGTAPVYNLTVDGDNEYFANGILVHNCDVTSYAVKELLSRRVDGNDAPAVGRSRFTAVS